MSGTGTRWYAWQSQWWAAFGARHKLTPCFLEFRRDGAVRGRASLFRRRLKIKGVGFQTLEVLGNLWQGPATFRSEFLDVLAEPSERASIARTMLDWVSADAAWDVLACRDLDAQGALARHLETYSGAAGLPAERSDEGTAFEVRTEGDFEAYRASLSANVRRKMFGQRRRLEDLAQGPVHLSEVQDFTELERLHTLRWGSPLLHGGRVEFLQGLRAALPEGSLTVSLFSAGQSCVSALLNARAGDGRIYNLQGGFDARSYESISPARLHWGQLIEQAFATRACRSIDLLLGGGRHDDYKREMATPGRTAVTYRCVRHPLLRAAQSARRALAQARSMADAK
jgi:hypothetical protein